MSANRVRMTGTPRSAQKMATGELEALAAHLDECRRACGVLFALRCAADDLRVFVASHSITTVLVGLLLMQVVALGS